MLHEPEILISKDRCILQRFSQPETLAVCWDASADSSFSALFEHINAFNHATLNNASASPDELLAPVEEYAQKMIDGELNPIIENTGISLSGYDELNTWIVETSDEISEGEAIPHRDSPSIGLFFYFNDQANLSTSCIPTQYTGKPTQQSIGAGASYTNADVSKAVTLPSKSVALVKLGELTHYGPSSIPEETCRIVMHARYSITP